MDITKMTSAPWVAEGAEGAEYEERVGLFSASANKFLGQFARWGTIEDKANVTFIALARNAFDVMMRRGWSARLHDGSWHVADCHEAAFGGKYPVFRDWCIGQLWTNPFSALVDADYWLTVNVES